MNEDKKTRILTAAKDVFLRYGYRRVSMKDIADASGISRPALYLLFKSKEEIFIGVYLQWVADTIADIEAQAASAASPAEKLEAAFELWAVRPFELMLSSPEAKELIDCTFDFARASKDQAYARFEKSIVPILASLAAARPARAQISPKRVAHVLACAVQGFKHAAGTHSDLRKLIRDLLAMSLAQYE